MADLAKADIRACARFLVENFVPHGYAVALIPTRGVGNTDGCPNLFGKIERSDLDDALNYLGTREWSAGKIAMYGLSYDGSTPWVAAATGNPYLKTILPASGVNDLYDLSFGAGTLDWRFWFFVSGLLPLLRARLQQPGRLRTRSRCGRSTPSRPAPTSCEGDAASVRERDHRRGWTRAATGPSAGCARWSSATTAAACCSSRACRTGTCAPAHTIPWTVSLRDKGIVVKQLLGQWPHAHPDNAFVARTRALGLRRPGAGLVRPLAEGRRRAPTPARQSRSRTPRGGGGARRRWPPANGETLHLTAGRTLAAKPTAAPGDGAHRPGLAQPPLPDRQPGSRWTPRGRTTRLRGARRHLPHVRGVLDDRAPAELRISGLPEVFVDATPTTPSGHVTAVLYRRGADGLHRLGWGNTDLRFPAGENTGDETARARWSPASPERLRIELEPLDAVVHAGRAARARYSARATGCSSAGGPSARSS